jgi:hypothetical protein
MRPGDVSRETDVVTQTAALYVRGTSCGWFTVTIRHSPGLTSPSADEVALAGIGQIEDAGYGCGCRDPVAGACLMSGVGPTSGAGRGACVPGYRAASPCGALVSCGFSAAALGPSVVKARRRRVSMWVQESHEVRRRGPEPRCPGVTGSCRAHTAGPARGTGGADGGIPRNRCWLGGGG